MNESVQPLIGLLGRKLAWLPHILAVIGAARLFCKWFSAQLQDRLTRLMAEAVADDDQAEERDWEVVLRARWYRIAHFTLDLVLSIKLPVLADFLRLKAQGKSPQNQNPMPVGPGKTTPNP
ncbi:MAG: hypothetical protein ACLQVX_06000 [Limisphaerales bacterium]